MTNSTQIRARTTTLLILKEKKKLTGRSIPDLVEFAVHNMPYIPPKKRKRFDIE